MRRLLFLLLVAAPLAAAEIPLSEPSLKPLRYAWDFVVANDGRDVLVAWRDVGGGRIRYSRVLRGGVVVADVPAKLLTQNNTTGFFSAAFSGGRYLISWSTSSGIECALLDRDGNELRRLSFDGGGSTTWTWPVVAVNGHFLLTWTSRVTSTVATVVTADGDVAASVVLPFLIGAACASDGTFAVVSRAEYVGCPFGRDCTIRHTLARIATDGRVVAQATADTFFPGYTPELGAYSMASGSDGGLLTTYVENPWGDHGPPHLRTILTDSSLRQLDVPMTFDKDFVPSDARTTTQWDGGRYLIAMNTQNGFAAMRVGRDRAPVTFDGGYAGTIAVDPDGYFVVLNGPVSVKASFRSDLTAPSLHDLVFPVIGDQWAPSVATDGRSLLAGWGQDGGGNVVRLESGGQRTDVVSDWGETILFDGTDYVIFGANATRFFSPDGVLSKPMRLGSHAIWNGSLFFVFEQIFESIRPGEITLRRLDRGQETAAGRTVVVNFEHASATLDSMATNGHDVFLIIRKSLDVSILARVTPEGTATLSGALPFATYDYTNCTCDRGVHLAATGDTVFAMGTGDGKALVLGAWTLDLRPRWPAPIVLSTTIDSVAAVAADGDAAVVVWHEPRRIVGARVTRDGAVTPFIVAEIDGQLANLRVAARGGTTVVAYARYAAEAPYFGAGRPFVQWMHAPPPRRPAAGR